MHWLFGGAKQIELEHQAWDMEGKVQMNCYTILTFKVSCYLALSPPRIDVLGFTIEKWLMEHY